MKWFGGKTHTTYCLYLSLSKAVLVQFEKNSLDNYEVNQYWVLKKEASEYDVFVKEIVKLAPVQKQNLHVVLDAELYELLLIDKPSVKTDELESAVHEELEGLIEQDIKNVEIKSFELPVDAYQSRGDKLYSVIVDKELIQLLHRVADEFQLHQMSIGISELALLSIYNQIPAYDDAACALVTIKPDYLMVTIVENGQIYLIRKLFVAAGSEDAVFEFEQASDFNQELIKDILWSVEYYESNMGKSEITQVKLIPYVNDYGKWITHIEDNLNVQCELLLPEIWQNSQVFSQSGITPEVLTCSGACLVANDVGGKK